MSSIYRTGAALIAGALALPACGASETSATSSPVPADDAGADVSDDVVVQESGAALRTVQLRNPFGTLDPANKLHDGDFELSGTDSAQYPWFFLEQKMIVTGTECRSGLRCLKLEPGDFAAGAFVWPDAPYAEVSFWARSPGQACEQDAPGFVWQIDSTKEPTPLGVLTTAPQDGWCQYGGVVQVDPSFHFYTVALVRRHDATGAVLFDQASLSPRTEPPANLRSLVALTERDSRIVAAMRKRTPELYPHRPPREPRPIRNPTGRRSSVLIP